MIRATVVNKSKPRTLLLVHGLFASAGYWLPYLQILRGYRLLVADIDYRGIRDIDPYLQAMSGIIAAQAGGRVDGVISHSLGCLLAGHLPEDVRGASFEVCPVYCAERLGQDDFVGEIARKTGPALSLDAIRSQLAEVDGALAAHGPRAQAQGPRAVYLPDADRYFSYRAGPGARRFSGDHFEIAEAVADIDSRLAA